MAFLSSRIEETEWKVFSTTGARVEFGGLTDVETGVSRDWRKSLYAVSNWQRMWSGVESGSLCMTLTDQHSWKGIWGDRVWITTGMSGFDYQLYPRNFSRSIGSGTGSTQPREDNWVATSYEK